MRSVSSAGASIRPMTTVVVNELTREYSDVLADETIKACARAAIRDLRRSINPEAVPEMAGRLAQGSGAACGDGRQFRRARRLQRGTTRRKPGPLLTNAHTSIIGTARCGISPVVAPPVVRMNRPVGTKCWRGAVSQDRRSAVGAPTKSAPRGRSGTK
jgi:hypothetical protein